MLSRTNSNPVQLSLFATAESLVENNKTTLTDKNSICQSNSQTQKSSKILVQDSTINAKVLKPYWNDVCGEISSKLFLPIGIDLSALDLNSSSLLSNTVVEKSWFSTIKVAPLKANLPKTYFQSCTSSVVGCTAEEATLKSKKIRIYPTPQQKVLLKHWFGVSRYAFNKTVEYLKQPETKANWKAIKTELIKSIPEWSKSVPYQIKSIAIRDACIAVRDAKKKTKNGQPSFVKYRSRKDRVQSVFIPFSAIKQLGIYPTVLGKLIYKEPLPEVVKDSRLILHRGQYFLCVSTQVELTNTDNQSVGIVALDPGVRTFLTFYSPTCFGKIGHLDFGRIQRLCYYLDRLISKMSQAKARQKRRLKKAADRLRTKITNLIKEVHHQTANWLTKEFNIILLPTFETSQMSSRASRRIRSKTVRAMLTWSHYKFEQFLLHKAKERNKTVLLVDESYTSKTVPWTGEIINNLGGKKKVKSKLTNTWMDRDISGALGILLKALVDTPSLDVFRSAFVNKH
jgi:putative transposase